MLMYAVRGGQNLQTHTTVKNEIECILKYD